MPETQSPRLSTVKHTLAIASGKGGVGKSTVAVNLALALLHSGAKVGVLDADIYGPSTPTLLGLKDKQPAVDPEKRKLVPLEKFGLKIMSIGFLMRETDAVVWRGPMIHKMLQQFLDEVDWGTLDYLLIDLPPGTGDAQLSLSQLIPLSGVVIVTTPQDIALADARKGVAMFEKVSIPVLGIIENMSVHVCSNCGHTEHIFGSGGGTRIAGEYGVPLLGELPLDARIQQEADGGRPSVIADPASARAQAYVDAARRAAAALAHRARDRSALFPKIVVEDS